MFVHQRRNDVIEHIRLPRKRNRWCDWCLVFVYYTTTESSVQSHYIYSSRNCCSLKFCSPPPFMRSLFLSSCEKKKTVISYLICRRREYQFTQSQRILYIVYRTMNWKPNRCLTFIFSHHLKRTIDGQTTGWKNSVLIIMNKQQKSIICCCWCCCRWILFLLKLTDCEVVWVWRALFTVDAYIHMAKNLVWSLFTSSLTQFFSILNVNSFGTIQPLIQAMKEANRLLYVFVFFFSLKKILIQNKTCWKTKVINCLLIYPFIHNPYTRFD